MDTDTKITKPPQKVKEKLQAKLLFEPIRKAQRQCKTTMAEITGKVQKENQSLATTLETENKIIFDKNAIAEKFNTFL